MSPIPRPAWIGVAVALVASVWLELAFHGEGHHGGWHAIPSFDFWFGLAGCVAIVLGSKWLGKHFLQRPEDYYGDEGEGEP